MKKATQMKSMQIRTFFCPLCGFLMIRGPFNYWCTEHGAFDVLVNDHKPAVVKLDVFKPTTLDYERWITAL